MNEALDLFFTASLWAAVFRIATPLIFGMLGELICERAGVVNLGIEGIMTFGALSAWLAVFHGCDLWTGMLVAAASGAAFGLLHALLTVPMAQSQHVTGLGITLLATSLASFIYRLAVPAKSTPPTIMPFQPVDLPFLNAPFLAATAPTYLALGLTAVVAYVLWRTPLGLAIRMAGEHPQGAQAQGINVLVSPGSVELLTGATLDFVEINPGEQKFIFINPNDPSHKQPIAGAPARKGSGPAARE